MDTTDRRVAQMQTAIDAAWGVLGAAVAARRALETAQSPERVKLSVKGWTDALLALAGHDEARARELDARMGAAPHVFRNALAYRHQVARHIVDGWWWAPGPSTPTVAADKDLAQMEVQQVPGSNLYTLARLAVTDAERMNPAAFGETGDLEKHQRQRAGQTAHAKATMAAVVAIPDVLLHGMASMHGIDVEPVGSLPERLIAAAMAGPVAPRQAGRRITEGRAILVGR